MIYTKMSIYLFIDTLKYEFIYINTHIFLFDILIQTHSLNIGLVLKLLFIINDDINVLSKPFDE